MHLPGPCVCDQSIKLVRLVHGEPPRPAANASELTISLLGIFLPLVTMAAARHVSIPEAGVYTDHYWSYPTGQTPYTVKDMMPLGPSSFIQSVKHWLPFMNSTGRIDFITLVGVIMTFENQALLSRIRVSGFGVTFIEALQVEIDFYQSAIASLPSITDKRRLIPDHCSLVTFATVVLMQASRGGNDPHLSGFSGGLQNSDKLFKIYLYFIETTISDWKNHLLARTQFLSPSYTLQRDVARTVARVSGASTPLVALADRARIALSMTMPKSQLYPFVLAKLATYKTASYCASRTCPNPAHLTSSDEETGPSNSLLSCVRCQIVPYCDVKCQRPSFAAHKSESKIL